jgi:hypothetical protein
MSRSNPFEPIIIHNNEEAKAFAKTLARPELYFNGVKADFDILAKYGFTKKDLGDGDVAWCFDDINICPKYGGLIDWPGMMGDEELFVLIKLASDGLIIIYPVR